MDIVRLPLLNQYGAVRPKMPLFAPFTSDRRAKQSENRRETHMPKKIQVYPSFRLDHPVASDKPVASDYGFPELNDALDQGRAYPARPESGFAEDVVEFLRKVLHRR